MKLLKRGSYFHFFLILTDGVYAKRRVIYLNVSSTGKISENPPGSVWNIKPINYGRSQKTRIVSTVSRTRLRYLNDHVIRIRWRFVELTELTEASATYATQSNCHIDSNKSVNNLIMVVIRQQTYIVTSKLLFFFSLTIWLVFQFFIRVIFINDLKRMSY